MALDEKELAAATEKAKGEGERANQDRVKAITAEFTDDPAFALDQIGKGSSLAEAKANYAGVLRERLKTANAKNAELEAKATAAPTRPAGAPALPTGGDPSEANAEGQDFLAAAEAYAEKHGCTKTEAMSKLSRGGNGQRNSQLFQKHMDACVAAAPEHEARTARAKQTGVAS